MPTVRLLPFETLSGPLNMAADEALLHTASADGMASLRFYGWSEPTLSLGYFQPAADRLADPMLAKLPWACRFHHIVTAALAKEGAATRSVLCGQEAKLGQVLCFLHQTPGDLLAGSWEGEAPAEPLGAPRLGRSLALPKTGVNPAKVVGSAQRKQKGALLQHGGILLARSEFAPRLPGLFELTGVRLTSEQTAKLVTAQFARDTGWDVVPGEWAADELVSRERIAAERYSSVDWNEKR